MIEKLIAEPKSKMAYIHPCIVTYSQKVVFKFDPY